MVAFDVVGRFRQQNDLRAYRRKLASLINQDFALRLLPALAGLPLWITGPDGEACGINEVLRSTARVTLSGASGSGRRLALQQLALRWIAGEEARTAVPVLLSLPHIDDQRSAPADLIAASIQAAIQATEQKPSREILARLRLSSPSTEESEARGRWLLLINGWEELSEARRAAWRTTLIALPQHLSTLQMVVAIPEGEPAWSGFTALEIPPPAAPLLARWIDRLVTGEQRTRMLAALDGKLHVLRPRLFEIALLAWLAPWAEMPATRADLYAQVLAKLLGLPAGRLAHAPQVVELQLLAAYDEPPSTAFQGLLAPGAHGGLVFAHPQARRYLAARQLLDERQLTPLLALAPAERAELALLITTMLDDPLPLYQVLWGTGRLGNQDILTLGRCLHERAPHSPSWVLRVSSALGHTFAHGGSQAARARELLLGCAPLLDASMDAIAITEEPARRFLLRLFELLPPELAARRLEPLAYADTTPVSFAWDLADLLAARSALDPYTTAPAPATPAGMARWIYVQALRGPQRRQPLDATIVATQALPALAESRAGEARKLQAAVALLDDRALPTSIRLAALALIEASDQPTALTVIEHALGNETGAIRQRALEALNQRDPERAYTALSRVALDEAAPRDTRLRAVEHLGEHLTRGGSLLLERCASDTTLPLYTRLRAVAKLGQQSAGLPHLQRIVRDTRCQAEIRAAAARQLGPLADETTTEELLQLLDDPATTPVLAAGICDGLHLPGGGRAAVLWHKFDTIVADVPLMLAVVRAVGRLGSEEFIVPLSRLLGTEALNHLQRDIEPRLHQLDVNTCLADPSLPKPIALRLSTTLALSATEAERPTTLIEFLIGEADRLRLAATEALASIGGNAVHAALLAALLDGGTGGATAAVIDALVKVDGLASTEALGYLLGAEEVNPLTRWLIVQRLAAHPDGESVMLQALARADIDPFTRGALAEGIGRRGALGALPLLRQLADDPAGDDHLRAQTILALGLLDDPATETPLLNLLRDEAQNVTLRGMAAEHLPTRLSDEGRRFLRDLLRRERPPAPIIAGALRALGRALDHEALPLMLRYCQDELAAVVQAAITALADLGDASVAPVLVRITQNPNFDRAMRLQAIGTLLRIGGEGYQPLLRTYLEHGPLPLQLQALEHLIAAPTPAGELLALLAGQTCPLPLRLRLAEHLAGTPVALPVLLEILADQEDDTQLRIRAVETLARARHPEALPVCIQLAEEVTNADVVRLHCIDALGRFGGTDAWLALSRLAEDSSLAPVVRERAIQALNVEDFESGKKGEFEGAVPQNSPPRL